MSQCLSHCQRVVVRDTGQCKVSMSVSLSAGRGDGVMSQCLSHCQYLSPRPVSWTEILAMSVSPCERMVSMSHCQRVVVTAMSQCLSHCQRAVVRDTGPNVMSQCLSHCQRVVVRDTGPNVMSHVCLTSAPW